MGMTCRVDDVNANKLFHSESIEKRIHGYLYSSTTGNVVAVLSLQCFGCCFRSLILLAVSARFFVSLEPSCLSSGG